MTRNLESALEEQKQNTEQFNQRISGVLGIPLGGQKRIEVPNRNAYVYVRLRSNQSEVIQAYNNTVATSYGLPVLVERQGNRYVVVSVDTQRYDNNWSSQSPFLPRHGNSHSFDIESGGGGDIVWVYPRQITPILVMPSGSAGAENVIVNPYTLRNDDGTWKYVGNTGTASLAPYRPTNPTGSIGAVMALIYLDSVSGNPYFLINSGSVFSNTITGSAEVVPYIPRATDPTTQIPLAAIRLITGTNQISWDNIYDVRQFLHTIPTGSGGGGLSSVPVYNTGTFVGNAASLDFQYPLFAGFTGTTAYPSLGGTLLAHEDVSGQLISGSSVNHFTLTGTIDLGTDRLYYNGLRQRRADHYIVDSNGRGFNTIFTGTFGDVLVMEYGNLGVQAGNSIYIRDEGVDKGSVSILDFVGENVEASISGSVARVFVTGSSSGGDIGASVRRTSNQTIGNNVFTSVIFTSELYDTDNIWSSGTAMVCRTAGKYVISANVAFAFNATGIRIAHIRRNISTAIAEETRMAVTDATFYEGMNLSTTYSLEVNDVITLVVLQKSGGDLDIEQAYGSAAAELKMQKIG